jgi:hypothetical protein
MNIGRIFFDTWHIIYHDVEEYYPTCTWMNDNYGWNIIMDEKIKGMTFWFMDEKLKWMSKIKWMKNWNGWTQHVDNQKLCANVNSTSSQPRGLYQPKHYLFISKRYVPIWNWNNMRPHILNTISPWFFF